MSKPAPLTPDNTPDPSAWIRRFDSPLQQTELGSIAGLRFAAKDNIDVANIATTVACPDFTFIPENHAAVVQRLLDAGGVLVGKTNLDQFACGLSGTRSPYGIVPNTFDSRYVCGGSSSGSAYVVARGQVDFALGTDTAGSGRVPAGLNNIVGLKPSRGLISARGVFPAMQSVDCVSILACTVATAVRVLKVAAGFDAQDPYSRALKLDATPFAASFRFGVPDAPEFYGDTLSAAAFASAIARLESLGGQAIAIDYSPFLQAGKLLYGSALVTERYWAIQRFFDANPDAVMEPVRSIIGKGAHYSAINLRDAQHHIQTLIAQTLPLWQRIDVLCVPTTPTHCTIEAMLAKPVEKNQQLGYYTNFVNLLDYAALSVPSSLRPDGLPFGITLIAPAGSDLRLAELGQRYHHATGLLQGATQTPLPPPQNLTEWQMPTQEFFPLAVVGAHLSGMPLNHQLIECGARLDKAITTSSHYRLFALSNTAPPKPGLKRVEQGGAPIAIEIWHIPVEFVGAFMKRVSSPLAIGSIELSDGQWVHGFVCEDYALLNATDITSYGGWRAYAATAIKA